MGNPLICGTSSNEGCFGSVTLVPPSSFLESSPGNAPKSKPSSGFRPPLSFSLIFVYLKIIIFLLVFDRKTQVQETSNCTRGHHQLYLSLMSSNCHLVQKETEKPNYPTHQWSVVFTIQLRNSSSKRLILIFYLKLVSNIFCRQPRRGTYKLRQPKKVHFQRAPISHRKF